MRKLLVFLALLIPTVSFGSAAELAVAGMPAAEDPDYKVALISVRKGNINPADFHQAVGADIYANGVMVWNHLHDRDAWDFNPLDRLGVGRIVRDDAFEAADLFPLGSADARYQMHGELPGLVVVQFHLENDRYDGHLGLRMERLHADVDAAVDVPDVRSPILQSMWRASHFARAESFPILAVEVTPRGFADDGTISYRLSPVGEGIRQIQKETAAALLAKYSLPR